MEDVFGCLAQRLAQGPLWRVDTPALVRLASVCRAARAGAANALEGLRVRELARRKRVAGARRVLALAGAFLKGGAMLSLTSAEVTLIRVDVTFNGRIRIREGGDEGLYLIARITLRQEEASVSGRVLVVYPGAARSKNYLSGSTFTDLEGLLGALRYGTLLGRERWKRTHPKEWETWTRYVYDQPNMVYYGDARVFH